MELEGEQTIQKVEGQGDGVRQRYIDRDRGRRADGEKSEQIRESQQWMDAVSRTGVVLSWLFGQMAVCVLITD